MTFLIAYCISGLVAVTGQLIMYRQLDRDARVEGAAVQRLVAAMVTFPVWPILTAAALYAVFRKRDAECAYCGHMTGDAGDMRRHILTCDKHPLARVRAASYYLISELQTTQITEPVQKAIDALADELLKISEGAS